LLVTKAEFVDRIAAKTDLSRKDAAKAVDAFLDTVTESLRQRQEITFTGFGKFSTQRRAARMGVNPRDPRQKVEIPAATVPKFSAGSSLKSAVRSGGARSLRLRATSVSGAVGEWVRAEPAPTPLRWGEASRAV
jgi:DNA-binding protein HU-beta